MTRDCDACAVRRHLAPPAIEAVAVGATASSRAAGTAASPQVASGCSDGTASPTGASGHPRSRPEAFPGITDSLLVRLLTPVLPPIDGSPDPSPGDPRIAADVFARVALGTAIEPGDQVAGRVLHALGPVAFVRAIIDGTDARGLLQPRRECGDDFSQSGDPEPPSPSGLRDASLPSHDTDSAPLATAFAAAGSEAPRAAVSARATGTPPSPGNDGAVPPAADWGPSLGAAPDPAPQAPRPSRRPRATSLRGDGRAEGRLGECLVRWRSRLSLLEAQRVLERAARLDSRLLTPHSRFWPSGFESLDEGAPLALWIRGDAARLARLERSIALVGARAATAYGEHVAGESAAGLADRGFAIVSGGAYGIDAAAHRAALASGGVTVAFLAGGVDRLYPAGNSDLLRRIAATGVLAAELPPGSTPTRWRFLMRNRLIAAAATATVVVEAGHRSGSLNTAGHAAQMARPLGAVPGSVLSPASAGSHRLIREYAATCVTTVDEMAELADPLGSGTLPSDQPVTTEASLARSEPEAAIVAQLSESRAATADEVATRAGLPFATVAAVLGRMELDGRVRERAGGWVLIGGIRRGSR